MLKQNEIRKYLMFGGVAFAAVLSTGGYFYWQTFNDLKLAKNELENTKLDLAQLLEKNQSLSNDLETEKYKNSQFSGQIQEIASTVGTLDKLSKTDRELLQKYSKVYFLNEHYVPDSLTKLPPDYLHEKEREMQIHSQVYPYLQNMVVDAGKNGIDLKIISAYRSFGEQGALKTGYTFVYGTGANRFSADQGYSEHQLGTAIDLTTPETAGNFNQFKNTPAYTWLRENAYKYGFVLSYPENNSYYEFEPWHWRFVGKKLAYRMKQEGENFYDLSQSIIDNYLITIFD